MENSLMTWLFNYASLTAIAFFMTWAVWRLGALSGKYETRFTRIESDLTEVKSEVKEMKKDVGDRLGRLEGRMELVITLLTKLIDKRVN